MLLVTEFYPPVIYGGGEIGARVLAETLMKHGIKAVVLTSELKNKKIKNKEKTVEKGVEVYRILKTGDPLSFFGNIKRLIFFHRTLTEKIQFLDQRENFDIIHFLNKTSITDLKEKNNKTVSTINSCAILCPKGNLFYKEKGPCYNCSFFRYIGCIVHSEYIGRIKMPFFLKYNPLFWLWNYLNYKNELAELKKVEKITTIGGFIVGMLKNTGIPQERLFHIPNFTRIKKSKSQKKKNKKELVVSYIGGLEKMKGVLDFLESYKVLEDLKESKNIKFMVVGDGNLRDSIKSICKKSKNKGIDFVGSISHNKINRIYSQSDIIVIPSLWSEAFCRVLVEALYFGKPVIATDVGGNKDFVINNKTGYLLQPDKNLAEEIAKSIIKLKDNKTRKLFGKNAKSFYNEKLEPNKVIKQMIGVYKQIDNKTN